MSYRKEMQVICSNFVKNFYSGSSKENKATYSTLYSKSPVNTPTRNGHPETPKTPTSPVKVLLTSSTVYCEVDCSPINVNALNQVMKELWKGSPPSFPDL